MGKDTAIQWCNYSWSPWLGCRKVSPGCEHCYIIDTPPFKFRKIKHGAERVRTSESYWKQPLAWDRKAAKEGVRARVFPSLCDPFDTEAPFEWFKSFMDLIVHCPNLDWLLLTKRPQEAVPSGQAWAADHAYNWTGFPPNVWIGTSVEDQQRADERIPILLTIPAKVRFLSVEPLLCPVELELVENGAESDQEVRWTKPTKRGQLIDWVIVGGESGKNARPCSSEWIRSIMVQCKDAGVPVFVKQLGSFSTAKDESDWFPIKHPKGGDPSEWTEDLQVRQFPLTRTAASATVPTNERPIRFNCGHPGAYLQGASAPLRGG